MDPNRRTDSRRGGSGLRNGASELRPNFQPARDPDDWHSRGSGSRDERDLYHERTIRATVAMISVAMR